MNLFFGKARCDGGFETRAKRRGLERFLIKFTFWFGLSSLVLLYGAGYYQSYAKIHATSIFAGLIIIWQIVGLLSGNAVLKEELRIRKAREDSVYGDAEEWFDDENDYHERLRKFERGIWFDVWITIILFCATIFVTSSFLGWEYL